MKHRLERVRELIKRELSDLIHREIRFDHLVTIQEVSVTPDLKQAHIYVSVLGNNDPKAAARCLGQLNEKRKELQYLLSRRVILKYTPQLHFKLDEALERGTRVISLMETLEIPEDTEEEGTKVVEDVDDPDEEVFERSKSPSLNDDDDDDGDDDEVKKRQKDG